MMKNKILLRSLLICSFVPIAFTQNIPDLKIDSSFKIEIFASDIDSPRQIAEGSDGRIYVGSRNAGKIFSIRDTDKNGVIDEKILVAENLTYATGVSLHDGDLYFSEISKIWKIENVAGKLNKDSSSPPQKTLVTDNLPSDKWHGWKWIKHDEDGNLYTNVGAPCNVCESEDKRHASIIRLNGDSWDFIARLPLKTKLKLS